MFLILLVNFLIFSYWGENDMLEKSNKVLAWMMLPFYQILHFPLFSNFWEYIWEQIIDNIEYFDYLTLQEL